MKILSINSKDIGGGAEKVAMDLHRYYLALGIDSKMLVGHRKSDFPFVYEIPKTDWYQLWDKIDKRLLNSQIKGAYLIHKLVKDIKAPFLEYAHKTGKENYHYPESCHMVKKLQISEDIVHMHNLHNEYFDLRMLTSIFQKKPLLITMHDEYLYTGHCACSLGCERWRTGCGECPHLDIYPAVEQDNTRFNWERKKSIFLKSQLTLVTPSVWLAQRAKESFLSHLPVRVIPNGVDLEVFKPDSQTTARYILELDQQAFIILFMAAYGRLNPFKDFEMLDRVIVRLQKQSFDKPIILIALGGEQSRKEFVNGIWMVEIPFIKGSKEIAKYYQACDLFIHTAKAETFGLVIIEAMTCGKAVVSTNAGGIPELVREDETGYIVPIGDDEAMAKRIISLINEPDQLRKMGERAAQISKNEYGLERMSREYLSLYQEVIDERNR